MKNEFKKDLKEYNAGYDSGQLHGTPIPGVSAETSHVLSRESLVKMEKGRKDEAPLIRAFWQGYFDAYHGYLRNPNYCRLTVVNH